ncbi:transport protein particle component [Thelonectria olida]|uniref:Transport protein particle component n=1 Tax=Thelonectria olida TaxID=1576542 RepID=A0A9P8WC69_9HYPO|nr:transport protein particle component [Thelonectria olida]
MSFEPVMPPYNSSDPTASFLSSSCLDFLLIELVPLAYRVTHDRDAPVTDSAISTPADGASTSHAVSSNAAGVASGTGARKVDDEEDLDAVQYRLEMLGYRVGQGLVERFSKDRPRFNDTLDVIKFLCKDLWTLVFGKNIDNLKTNHRGVYVLTDNVFRPFSRMSTEAGGQAIVRAQPVTPPSPLSPLARGYMAMQADQVCLSLQFLWFPCGVVKGALAALGINTTVQAEINELPGAVFQIKTIPNKP